MSYSIDNICVNTVAYDKVEGGYKVTLITRVLRGQTEAAAKEHDLIVKYQRIVADRIENAALAMSDTTITTVLHYQRIVVREEGEFDSLSMVGGQDAERGDRSVVAEAGAVHGETRGDEVSESVDRSRAQDEDAPDE